MLLLHRLSFTDTQWNLVHFKPEMNNKWTTAFLSSNTLLVHSHEVSSASITQEVMHYVFLVWAASENQVKKGTFEKWEIYPVSFAWWEETSFSVARVGIYIRYIYIPRFFTRTSSCPGSSTGTCCRLEPHRSPTARLNIRPSARGVCCCSGSLRRKWRREN